MTNAHSAGLRKPVFTCSLPSCTMNGYDLSECSQHEDQTLLSELYGVQQQLGIGWSEQCWRDYVATPARLRFVFELRDRQPFRSTQRRFGALRGGFTTHVIDLVTPLGPRRVIRAGAFAIGEHTARAPAMVASGYILQRALRLKPSMPIVWFGYMVSPAAYCALCRLSGERLLPHRSVEPSPGQLALSKVLCEHFGLETIADKPWVVQSSASPPLDFRYQPGRHPNADFFVSLNPDFSQHQALVGMVELNGETIRRVFVNGAKTWLRAQLRPLLQLARPRARSTAAGK